MINTFGQVANVVTTITGLTTMVYALWRQFHVRVGENPRRVWAGHMTLMNLQFTVGNVIAHSWGAYLNATVTAVFAYLWWINGGDKGTKSKIKKWGEKLASSMPQVLVPVPVKG